MKVVIRAIESRRANVEQMLKSLPENTIVCYDYTGNAMDGFKSAMAVIGNDNALVLEDDVELTADFMAKAITVINEHRNELIQFFSMRKKDLEIGSRYESGRTFMMNQCVYYPAGMAAAILEYSKTWGRYDEHPTGLDTLTADYLAASKLKYWLSVPSLVQHLPIKSAIDPRRSTKRQSLTFEA